MCYVSILSVYESSVKYCFRWCIWRCSDKAYLGSPGGSAARALRVSGRRCPDPRARSGSRRGRCRRGARGWARAAAASPPAASTGCGGSSRRTCTPQFLLFPKGHFYFPQMAVSPELWDPHFAQWSTIESRAGKEPSRSSTVLMIYADQTAHSP